MRNKSLFLLVACVCGTIAAIGVSQWMQAQDKGQGGETVEIFVAAVEIDAGEEITADKIRLEQWPLGKEPAGSSSDVDAVLGKFAKTRFYAGESVLPVKLNDSNYSVIPRGFSVVAIKASDISIANVIQPGDPVNVMAYFTKSDLIPRSMTKTVLTGVRVYALDGDTERKMGDDRARTVRTIQLLIHKNDAEAWTYANELGKIRLSVGHDDDYDTNTAEDGSNLAGQEFLKWLDDYQRLQEEMLRPAPAPAATAASTPQATKKREGFSIVKIHAGRLTKYWIEPGKLPVIVEDTGPGVTFDPLEGETTLDNGNQQPKTAADDSDEDYSYLNGQDSPFYQPTESDRSSSDTDY